MNSFVAQRPTWTARVDAGLRTAWAALIAVLSFSASAAADNHWTGAIRCEIQVTAPGYSHQETQTWTLTGAAPTVQGAYEMCDATWSVTGQGWHDRVGQTARRVARWTADVPGASAPVAFFRPTPGKLVVQLRHAQSRSSDGYAGTEQYINNDGAARPERPLVQTLYEWTSWKIEALPTDMQITGSRSSQVSAGIAPLHPGDAQVSMTLTWALGRGTAPPMPPPTLPPPPAPPEVNPSPGASTGPAGPRAGAESGAVNGESAADVSTGEPRLLSVTPNFGAPGVSATLQLTGENTHWQAGGTMAAFGLGIAVTSLTVQSETGLTATVDVLPNTPAGPREVFVVSGAEFVRLADAFTVTSSSSGTAPRLSSVSPNSVEQGVALSVPITLSGEGTHWQVGTTTATFGPGITIATGRVNSPTSFGVQLTVGADAPPGPRTVTVTTGNEVVTLPNALTVVAREQPIVTQVNPSSARAGDQNVTVTFTGRGTRWEQGRTTLTFPGQGVTLAELPVVSAPTSMTVKLNVDASAAAGPRDISVLNTGAIVGSDSITLPGAFTVLPPAASIIEVTPSLAAPGARALTVSIKARGTHFNNVSWVEFGELVAATSFTVTSPTSATAVINIDPAAPPGPRTVSIITPVEGTAGIPGETASLPNGFSVGTPATSGRYRVTATRLKIHREEWDHRPKEHGRNNEIFVSKHALVIDRRNGSKIAYDDQSGYTPTHGDINNASDYYGELRIRAGSFASSGGIQTGDEIEVWGIDWAGVGTPGYRTGTSPQTGVATPAIATVVPSSQYRPFVLWEGNLNAGIEVALVRPAVWLAMEKLLWAGEAGAFFSPHRGRVRNETDVDFLALPAIRDALQRGLLIAQPPELATTGQWLINQHRPFGLVVNGNQNGSPAKFTDVVVVLTHEKLQEWLSGTESRTLELRMRSSMTGANPLPLGDCSLFVKIERLP